MEFIVDFYKGLDTVNLIIFWGVIIVVLLLLIFSIIIANKNKKLKEIIESKGIDIDNYNYDEELAIKRNIETTKIIKEPIIEEKKVMENTIKDHTPVVEEKVIIKTEIPEKNEDLNTISVNKDVEIPVITKEIEPEKKFVAEEHVMEYNKNFFSLPNIQKNEEIKEEVVYKKPQVEKKETNIQTGPYQRNVLREMSLNQTSPIGIVRRDNINESEKSRAKELQEVLHNEEKAIDNYRKEESVVTRSETMTSMPDIPKRNNESAYSNINRGNYLESMSNKLSNANNQNNIDRTAYELKQEEEAIISFEELMKKKDSIQMIDEEEAVISIEELLQRKRQQEKLYNITSEEENDEFINELKHFRSDL